MKKEFKQYEVEEFTSLRQAVKRHVDRHGDRAAFVFREKKEIKTVTYREFYNDSLYLGNALLKYGFIDKHVACIGENCYRWLVVHSTMMNSNGVYVPLDRQLPKQDIVTVLNHSDSEVLFFTKKYIKVLDEIRDELPNIKMFVCLNEEAEDGKFLSFDDLMAEGKELMESGFNEYQKIVGDTDALRLLVYTSGTTGMAKGVMLSERNVMTCINTGLKLTRLYDRAISLLPYHHTYEGIGLIAELACGVTVFINDSMKNILKNFAEFKPETAFLVPAHLEAFYKRINKAIGKKMPLIKAMIAVSNGLRKCGIDVRRKMFGMILESFGGELRKVISGGAPIRPEIADFFEAIGVTVVNGYGITECSPLVAITREGYDDCYTAGVPISSVKVKIKDPDENGIGEVCVKGTSVMLGYYKNQEATDRVMEDGWFNTEDLGMIDEEGRLKITGRSKNLIVLRNGKNIFPEEIENYILSIPYVAEAAVTAWHDESGEESGLCAHIYIDPQSEMAEDTDRETKIRDDVSKVMKVLPIYKQVSRINIRKEEFIKTTTNKIKRNEIEK
ncbi:MAG: AMP-dependent synthetase [Ruminococcaceae bacterium]|nr:AMP-dependent synthetase [Oscillospiraceae bacterium]